MATIDKFCAPGVFDPATYSQGERVTQAQTILFLSGQVAYTADGGVACRGDFKGQARGAFDAIKSPAGVAGRNDGECRQDHNVSHRHPLPGRPCALARGIFREKGPASTLVEISALAHPDWMIEIEAIAVV